MYPLLQSGATYTFTVRARNAYGLSTPVSTTVTMPNYPVVAQGGQLSLPAEIRGYRAYTAPPPSALPTYTGQTAWSWAIIDPSGATIGSLNAPNGWSVTQNLASTSIPNVLFTSINMANCTTQTNTMDITTQSAGFTITAPVTAPVGLKYVVATTEYLASSYMTQVWNPMANHYVWQTVWSWQLQGAYNSAPFNVKAAGSAAIHATPSSLNTVQTANAAAVAGKTKPADASSCCQPAQH